MLALLLALQAPVQGPPSGDPRLFDIVAAPSAARIEADIRRLVSFGTRNTMSDTLSATRGIGAARRWIKAEFDSISAACGGCLEVIYLAQEFPAGSGRLDSLRPTNIVNVVAIQRGTSDPNRFVVMAGDIDSRISNGSNAQDSSPGANDNASGMAGTIEAARVLSQYRFAGSIMYLGLSGEEQGLYGGGTVARHARAQGWNIQAVLNNDMIGNIQGVDGAIDNLSARVFSDGNPPIQITMPPPGLANADSLLRAELRRVGGMLAQRRVAGSDVDGTSRQVARYVDRIADEYMPTLDVMMIYRLDRFSRGGHHRPFADMGWPAVRIMETHENYTRQHQNIRVENGIAYGDVLEGVDWDYAAKLTALNAAVLGALAWAPDRPRNVRLSGAVQPAARLRWEGPTDVSTLAGYRVYWRLTDAPQWTHSRWVGSATSWTFDGLVVDNYYFGVAAVGVNGTESPVTFPGN